MGFSRNTPHSDLVIKFQPGVKLYVHNLEFSKDSTSRFALVDGVIDETGGFTFLQEPVWVSMSSNNLDFKGSVMKYECQNADGTHEMIYKPVKTAAKEVAHIYDF